MKTIQLKRKPTKSELRHIVKNIWKFWIDFQSLKEFDDTDQFYKDVLDVIEGGETIGCFASNYIGEELDDLNFCMVYDTVRYLLKKQIITKL